MCSIKSMELFILRHGIAVERGTEGVKNDFDRRLTPEGEEKLRRITRAMRHLQLSFDWILSSPYVRARETAELVASALALKKKIELQETLGADSNPREFIAGLIRVADLPKRVLVVGHEPSLSTLASLLLTGNAQPCLSFKKGGLAKLTVGKLRVGRCATLEWILTPKQMLLMA